MFVAEAVRAVTRPTIITVNTFNSHQTGLDFQPSSGIHPSAILFALEAENYVVFCVNTTNVSNIVKHARPRPTAYLTPSEYVP